MIFALGESQVIQGFGLQAGIVIVALVAVVIFLVRLLLKSYDTINTIQENRIVDARETRDKITEPLENQARVIEKIYDLLLSGRRK